RMLDMGFIDDVRLILERVPGPRQTTLFSATMPDEIIRLAHHYMKNPLRIFVDSDEIAVESVSQKYTWAEENEKFPALCSLIEAEKITRGLIFCSTKIRAGRLAQALRVEGYNAVAIHGDLSQGQRDRAMQAFRGGSVAVLVATVRGEVEKDTSGVAEGVRPVVHRDSNDTDVAGKRLTCALLRPGPCVREILRLSLCVLTRTVRDPTSLIKENKNFHQS